MPTAVSPWSGVVPDEVGRRYAAAGFGRHAGYGSRPALLVIDVQYRTVGHDRVPIEDAMKEYPTACGDRGWAAVDRIARLQQTARSRRIPVLFPYVAPKSATTPGGFRAKSPTLASPDLAAYDFVLEAAPVAGEPIVAKDHPSAFFGTGLITHLVQLGVDTVILTGCTTSGCVRATAVDAFSHGFRVGVVSDAVYDRADIVHAVSLFDLASKYADVVDVDSADAYLSTCGHGA